MMANGDFDLTHKKILECGKKIFKEKGFEKANLREICAQAGVTTGAFYGHFEDKEALFSELVQPVITDIEYHYRLLKQQSFTMYKKETVITKQTIESILDLKLKGAVGMVSYFFDNKDIFELLAFCSYGTKHEHFLDEIIEKEDENHLKILEMIHGKKKAAQVITKKGIHLLNHAYLYALSEVAVHCETKEEAERNAYLIADFFNEGWKKMRTG